MCVYFQKICIFLDAMQAKTSSISLAPGTPRSIRAVFGGLGKATNNKTGVPIWKSTLPFSFAPFSAQINE